VLEKPKIGEILLAARVIDEAQLKAALADQKRWGGRLGIGLIKLGFLSERDLVRGLASQLELPIADLEGKRIPSAVLELVPFEFAEQFTCLPLFVKEDLGIATLYLGMDDPLNLDVIDNLSFRIGMPVRAVVVAPSELNEGIDRFYRDLADNHSYRKVQAANKAEAPPASRDRLFDQQMDELAVTTRAVDEEPKAAAVPISKTSASVANPIIASTFPNNTRVSTCVRYARMKSSSLIVPLAMRNCPNHSWGLLLPDEMTSPSSNQMSFRTLRSGS